MDRSAPAGGYNFGAKIDYRKTIWSEFRSLLGKDRERASTLLMPSIEGVEISIAKSYGFPVFKMHVVDRNPAIVAHVKRRFPAVQAHGISLGRAVRKISRSGIRLLALNLDLCGNVGYPVIKELEAVANSLDPRTSPLLAVTVLRGRELEETQDEMDEWEEAMQLEAAMTTIQVSGGTVIDQKRLNLIRLCLFGGGFVSGDRNSSPVRSRFFPALLRAGIYKSTAGNQTMLWSIWYLIGRDAPWREVSSKTARYAVDALRAQFTFQKYPLDRVVELER